MVRLTDLPDYERDHLLEKCGEPLGPPAWVAPAMPLSEMRIALITTAGLHFRDDNAFGLMDDGFRPISNSEDPNDLVEQLQLQSIPHELLFSGRRFKQRGACYVDLSLNREKI